MKKIIFLILFINLNLSSFGQSKFEDNIKYFINETGAQVSVDNDLGNVHFVRFSKSKPLYLSGNSLLDKVNAFFNRYENIFIPNSDASHWVVEKTRTNSNLKTEYISLVQHINGIPVYGSTLKFHFDKEKKLTAINGWVIPNISPNASNYLDLETAKQLALDLVSNQHSNKSTKHLEIVESELVHYREGTIQNRPIGIDHLAYSLEISNRKDIRSFLLIDAITGKLIDSYSGICSIHRSLYNGDLDHLIWEEGDDFPGVLLSEWQERALISTEHSYNFFNNSFGHLSFDNNDAEMIILHNPQGFNCPNASWNGVHTNFCDETGSDDVTAHEWAHAYTQFTSGLIYAWQSGALNEAYSDIWGETIDLINNFEDDDEDLSLRVNCGDSDRWMIGEDATAFNGAIRDMWLPSCENDPNQVLDTLYYCNIFDNGGVHINSGVINHLYALLVDGGTFNNQTINPIGLTKAAHIFWHVQSTYLTPISDFTSFADALEAAGNDLIGINLESLSTAGPLGLSGEIIDIVDLESIATAINVLELREEPDCDFQTILSQEEFPLCENTDTLLFEDFENGINDWTTDFFPVNPDTWDEREWSIVGDLPNDRIGSAMFVPNPIIGNCQTDLENGFLRLYSPIINIPNDDNIIPHMAFEHYVATEPNWDGGNIKYSLNGGDWALVPDSAFIFNGYNSTLNGSDNPLQGQPAFTGVDEGGHFSTWGQSQIDLSLIGLTGGDDIQFRWVFGEDGCNGRHGWYVDDVLVYNCIEETSTSNPDLISDDQIDIFPNPFSDQIQISIDEILGSDFEINITDITGKIILSKTIQGTNAAQLNGLNKFSTGIYMIQIKAGGKFYIDKMIKY